MVEGDHRSAQWIEVSASALRHNLAELRGIIGSECTFAAVVKANAYGHGLAEVAPLAQNSADWLAVHSAGEAREIRRFGLSLPVLIMGFVPPVELHDLDAEMHILVSTIDGLTWLGNYRRRTGISLPVHLKIDTGTHRQGISVDRIPEMCRVASREGIDVVGVATHFANIEDTLEHQFARRQLADFHRAVDHVTRQLGECPPFVHAACSAAALLIPETRFSLVRIGISMYGHWPSRETRLTWNLDHSRDSLTLKPALSWHTTVGQLQDVSEGETVGYGRSWIALRPTRLAIVPVGYSDGYPRRLGNRARAIVGGRRAPVVGRVCMNILMLDVTDIPDVSVSDEVVLIGRQGDAEVSAEEFADMNGTINYEMLARLDPAIPRVVVDGPGPDG
jgi:alanine racemase